MSKAKKVNFELIDDTDSEPYVILAVMRVYHPDISEAAIAIAWRKELTPDKDGHLVLGKCVKTSDLSREFAAYDFIVVLNRETWADFTTAQKQALVDHELCHAAAVTDADGACYDERRRRVFRCRKHDIEEFQEVVSRHGCYKRDLELFAEALKRKRKTPLLDSLVAEDSVHVILTGPDGEVAFRGTGAEFHEAAKAEK